MSRSLVLSAVLLVAGSSFAQDYSREDLVRGLCQKDGCDEFAILDKQPVAKGPDGALYRTRVRTYRASPRGRSDQGEENGFVYCSPVRPAIISAPAGQAPTAFLLAPDEQAPAYVQRSTTNFYTLYFALCHGREAGKAASRNRQETARSLDYHVPLQRAVTMSLKQVEDILAPPNG